jgi:predicted nucleic acid-binding protein
MGTPSLLDSNCAIYLIKGGLVKNVEEELRKATALGCNLSVISQIELLGYYFPTIDVEAKTEKFVKQCTILPLDNEIVNKTIELRRLYKVKLPDAIIAATALVFDFTLISRNDKDFENIEGLKYLNPFKT